MALLRAVRTTARRLAIASVVLPAAILVMAEPALATSLVLDNDATGPLMSATALIPGWQQTQCISTLYQGASAGDQIALFGVATGSLAGYLQVKIDEGTGGSFGDCSGFTGTTIYTGTLATFATTYGSASSALPTATLAAGTGAISYRFTATLDDNNAAQGLTTTASFTWVAETNAVPPPSPTPSPTVTATPTPTAGAGSASTAPTPKPTASSSSSVSAVVPGTTSGPSPAPSFTSVGATGAKGALVSPSPSPSASSETAGQTTVPLFKDPNQPASGSLRGAVGRDMGSILRDLAQAALLAARGIALSSPFVLVILLFLLVHSRIDRRDPKLANAPMLPNFLAFELPLPGGSDDAT